jgi:hypothetical protein
LASFPGKCAQDDRTPEKRKVGSSTLPLTTRSEQAFCLLTCGNAIIAPRLAIARRCPSKTSGDRLRQSTTARGLHGPDEPSGCKPQARARSGRARQVARGVCGRACERLCVPVAVLSCCTELTLTCQGGSVRLPLATLAPLGSSASLASTVAGGDCLEPADSSKC